MLVSYVGVNSAIWDLTNPENWKKKMKKLDFYSVAEDVQSSKL